MFGESLTGTGYDRSVRGHSRFFVGRNFGAMRDIYVILIWSVLLSPFAIWFGGVYMSEKFPVEWWDPAPVPTVSPADAPATPLTGSWRSSSPTPKRTKEVVEAPMTTSRPPGRPTQPRGSTRGPSSVPDPYTTRRPTQRPPVLPPPTSQAPPVTESSDPEPTTEDPTTSVPTTDVPVETPSTDDGATT